MRKAIFSIIALATIVPLVSTLSCTPEDESKGLPPVADFSTDTNYVAQGVEVVFTDLSSNEPTEWVWDFGDGTNSTEQNPTHAYDELGTYDLSLTVSNANGSDTHNKNRYLIVHKDFDYGSLTDYDGNSYNTVQIGEQVWMAENLKVTHYPDGEAILNITDSTEWANLSHTDEAYGYYNNGNGQKHGGLYTYAAANKACPTGWHLPSDDEWKVLEAFIGMTEEDINSETLRGHKGGILKSLQGWEYRGVVMNGTDDYGFSALSGGNRNKVRHDGEFSERDGYGYWWSSTEGVEAGDAYYRSLSCIYDMVSRSQDYKKHGFSVRCVKD